MKINNKRQGRLRHCYRARLLLPASELPAQCRFRDAARVLSCIIVVAEALRCLGPAVSGKTNRHDRCSCPQDSCQRSADVVAPRACCPALSSWLKLRVAWALLSQEREDRHERQCYRACLLFFAIRVADAAAALPHPRAWQTKHRRRNRQVILLVFYIIGVLDY